ncbi:HAMP domain-containing histidine kinase [Nonomuraea sp. NN258]|uniref:sensor histidine kinase n=1 Tax=Nonomuraea antri TaxID=2730852 RepID=UPI001568BC15|nr:HAMP domain-containing sensor histidine kinase [Nonomuraea antri]NRQ31173.1 HAMP domain-containing histidine kinase [Nonomuraea antri]
MTGRPRPPAPERRLLVRARRRLTVQVAAAISVVLALVGVMIYCMGVHGQDAAARRDLATAADRAQVAQPPPCMWLFELWGGSVDASPAAPAGLPVRAELDRVAADGRTRVSEAELGGRRYLVRTQRRGPVTVQAVLDLRHQRAEQDRLLRTLALAEIAGLVAALLAGQVLARSAIAPLGEALARQRRFTADVSHELRTPLTRLHTRAQLVARKLRRGADPVLVLDEVDLLVAGTGQLGEVVADLLLSAQLTQMRALFGPVDLAALAEEVATAETARAEDRGVSLDVRSEGPGEHVVRGVRTALRRVISALVDNALRHTAAGGHVLVTLRAGPGVVLLSVRDDGTGLDPRDAERLFTRFARGDRGYGPGHGSNPGSGVGLGLALAREVVDAHGGTIAADGGPGAGAVFTVRLPADQPPAPPRDPPQRGPLMRGASGAGRTR